MCLDALLQTRPKAERKHFPEVVSLGKVSLVATRGWAWRRLLWSKASEPRRGMVVGKQGRGRLILP